MAIHALKLWLAGFKKKDVILLGLLLLALILPRIAVYLSQGNAFVGTDALYRYLPNAEVLSKDFSSFFSQTNALYPAFLAFLGVNNVTGPVIIQHILGIITALLVFFYFRKVNLAQAFILTVLVYSSVFGVFLEHSIGREAFTTFFIVLLVVLLSLTVKDKKHLNFLFGLLAGLTGVLLVLTRLEFLPLFIVAPLILIIVKKTNKTVGAGQEKSPCTGIKGKSLLKWVAGYYCLALITVVVFVSVQATTAGETKVKNSYGSTFNIAYHALEPDVFYYDNSRYPEILERYRQVLEKEGTVTKSMAGFYETTDEYLAGHPEIKLTTLQIMDKLYLEIMTRNTPAYIKSFLLNTGRYFIGRGEAEQLTIIQKNATGISVIDWPVRIYTTVFAGMYTVLLNPVFFWLSVLSIIILVIRWKTLPPEVITAFLVSAVQILVLSFVSNPIHRFRYPLDPFIYFTQIYLILVLYKTVYDKTIGKKYPSNYRL